MREDISVRARLAIEEKVFPGCVIGIIKSDGEREVLPLGRFTYENDSQEVTEGTIYDLASVTKSIPVASLVAMFIAEGKCSLNDKVTTFIPELQNDFDATIENLLRYEVRGPRMSSLEYPTFEQVRTHILEAGFDAPPGESDYTNLPAFLLGIILERVSGEILPALAHKYFFGPLNMNDTTFFPALRSLGEVGPHDISRIAPTELVDGQEIRGIVHDESARTFAAERRAVGHAGLFSTAPDLLTFLEALLQGTFPSIVEFAQDGLGWQREGELFGSSYRGLTSIAAVESMRFGKTGFTGTSVAVDPEKGIGLVILSNRTYPQRPQDSSAINKVRAEIADAIFGSFSG